MIMDMKNAARRAGACRRWLAACAALMLLAAMPGKAGAQAPTQAPTQADVLQLLAAAGMSVSNGAVLNPCQHATAPKVKFIDLNGDGQPEAVTQDQDPACYGPDPGYQSKILTRDAAGHWQAIVVMLGVFQPLGTRSKGWMDFTNASGSCHPVYRYNGRMYVATGCGIAAAPWQAPHGPDLASPEAAAPGPDDNLRLFPATYGSFAPAGNCARLPRVTVSATAIRLETAAGAASFARPDLVTNYGGPQDESITYVLQGNGEGLVVSINPDGKSLMSQDGDHLGAAERAVQAAAGNAPLLRCQP
jgi:hypothetical protein